MRMSPRLIIRSAMSLIDEKARQLRVMEVGDGASTSRVVEAERRTTYYVFIAVDTTGGVPTSYGAILGNRT